MDNRESLVNNVYDHMTKIYVAAFIREEFLEQEIFYSIAYLKKMLTWTLWQFEDWYDKGNNYCMTHY